MQPRYPHPPYPPYPQPPYQPYQQQHIRNTIQWELIVFTLLLGLVLVMLAFLYRSQVVELAQAIAPRCFVGIQGTAASITVIGFDAETMCQQLVQDHACENNPNCTQMTLYQLSSEPTQPEVCEGDYQNEHIIVRDEGIFKTIGNLLCSGFFPSSSH